MVETVSISLTNFLSVCSEFKRFTEYMNIETSDSMSSCRYPVVIAVQLIEVTVEAYGRISTVTPSLIRFSRLDINPSLMKRSIEYYIEFYYNTSSMLFSILTICTEY